ncbi:pentapeptide repeat-containing protein [Coleofasciculus sp. FACHB-501]|uniref:pentapeptide repeat-containing protein n=1 Tax=Cyanophyceae TaxID=3028117 RepID=UPI001685A554|nr:pentapeptide repeat-containing protein [Coleofasciculus sp. FACHB-501]MBD1841559.1 pentapeptide repeat-containing protein [Coleofasciculus sp. FACHB-501]
MATIQNQSEEDFAEAENKFALQKLKTALEDLKGSRISPAPWKYFKGVLCGYEPKEIATKCIVNRETVEISLNRNIKNELLQLIKFDENIRIDWSSVPKWLEKTEYKIQPIEESLLTSINQLGSENIQVRISAIYALERIAEDSPRDHWRIMEILTAFVRVNAPRKEGEQEKRSRSIPDEDIQKALTVIGQRDSKKEPPNQTLNLSKTDIRGANLNGANLQGANLDGANLQGVFFKGAKLQRVRLIKADLKQANLEGANLEGAELFGANLQGANLIEANLQDAGLDLTDLQETDLWYTNFQWTRLRSAKLQRAKLIDVNMEGAKLSEANLEGVNLNLVKNLEFNQIKLAKGDSKTVLPDNLEAPPHWMQVG